MGLQVGSAQPRIGNDVIEVVHQVGLGQRGQVGQWPIGRVGAERAAVVARAADRVLEERPQPFGLIGQQSLTRPAVVGQQLAHQVTDLLQQPAGGEAVLVASVDMLILFSYNVPYSRQQYV